MRKSPGQTREEMKQEWLSIEESKELKKRLQKAAFDKTDGRCWYCGIGLTRGKVPDYKTLFTVDHQIPTVKDGANYESNTVAACFSCNSTKGKKTVEEYRQWIAMTCGAFFTPKQIEFWAKRGISLPPPPMDIVPVFYGEQS